MAAYHDISADVPLEPPSEQGYQGQYGAWPPTNSFDGQGAHGIDTVSYYNSSTPGGYQSVSFSSKDGSQNTSRSDLVENGEKTETPGPPNLAVGGRRPRIHWRYPALAVFLYVAGVLFALGHDIYYSKLNGQRADLDGNISTGSSGSSSNIFGSLVGGDVSRQTWAIRAGTGLAFLNKTALAAVVALVGAQQVWYTLRRRAMTVDGIDSMFQVVGNPLALLNWDLLAHAKLLVVLAVISWLLPLASVVTPSTLSVQSLPLANAVHMAIPGFNYSDYRSWVAAEGPGYVTSAHFDIATLFSNMYSSMSFVSMPSAPFPNASYDQTLYGPSYKCISLNEALAANIPPTWTIDNPKGESNTSYKTFEDAYYGELAVPRVHDPLNYSNIVYSAAAPDYMFNTILISAGGTNPLWDAQGKNNNTLINSTTTAVAGDKITHETLSGPPGSNMVCQLYNTSFDVTIEFRNGVQSIVPRHVEYLEPQAWNYMAGMNSAGLQPCSGVNTSYARLSEDDPWSFSSRGNCNQTTAPYYVTHLLFTYLLSTRLTTSASGEISLSNQATLPLLQSPLFHCPDLYNSTALLQSDTVSSASQFNPARCRNGTLAAAIEDLSRNFTYSLLAFDGWSNYSAISSASVTHTENYLFFSYARSTLWAAYGTALGATLLTMLVGTRALWHNGVVSGTSFSATLLTTQNPTLHRTLLQGSGVDRCHPDTTYTRSVGAQPVDQAIGRLRLRFGHIENASGLPQAGFGADGTVRPF